MHLAIKAIHGYRRHLSPLKGYRCAYAVLEGSCSCSHYGERAIAKHGLRLGLRMLRHRMRRCRQTLDAYWDSMAADDAFDDDPETEAERRRRRIKIQRRSRKGDNGFLDCCDLPCVGFEAVDATHSVCDFGLGACDIPSC